MVYKKENKMNNQEKKLFNIACKIEKLLYEHCDAVYFNKNVFYNKLCIFTGRKVLNWNFLEPFVDLMKKNNITFSILHSEEKDCLQINITI